MSANVIERTILVIGFLISAFCFVVRLRAHVSTEKLLAPWFGSIEVETWLFGVHQIPPPAYNSGTFLWVNPTFACMVTTVGLLGVVRLAKRSNRKRGFAV